MRRLLILGALLVALPAGAVDIEWVYVGDPGNLPDAETNCFAVDCGSVPYEYYISKYEVTNAQYAEFLNAVAATDTHSLYTTLMESDATFGGITRSGVSGTYTYNSKENFANKPVTYVSFWDALRFANWLHNGQPTGAQDATITEDGAYAITPQGIADNSITRNHGAIVFLTSENEWYKAAYYDPSLVGYYDYPAGTDAPTACTAPSPTANTANCAEFVFLNGPTDIGAYTASPAPHGTFDQGGNVWEWNEEIVGNGFVGDRGLRGGSWYNYDLNTYPSYLAASDRDSEDPTHGGFRLVGLRVASVPEPAHVLLLVTGALVLAGARRADLAS